MKFYVDELREACGYRDEAGESIDALIAYKDALEDTLRRVELGLRHNALGTWSCADLAASLWHMGLDPNPAGTPVGEPE